MGFQILINKIHFFIILLFVGRDLLAMGLINFQGVNQKIMLRRIRGVIDQSTAENLNTERD